jgi:hypothetical protein
MRVADDSEAAGGSSLSAAAAAAAAVAAAVAAAAAAGGSSEYFNQQPRQQQQQQQQRGSVVGATSPFVHPSVQAAVHAAVLSDDVSDGLQQDTSSSSTANLGQQQQQPKVGEPAAAAADGLSPTGSSTSSIASVGSGSSAMRRSQSSQALIGIAHHSYPSAVNGSSSSSTDVRACSDQGHGSSSSSSSVPPLPPLPAGTSRLQPPPQHQQGSAHPSRLPNPAAGHPAELYDLRVVAHSLGGMSMLMYLVMRCAAGQPHHVRRLVLMSPAGYHHTVPAAFWPFIVVLPWWHKLLVLLVGRHHACEWLGSLCGCVFLLFRLYVCAACVLLWICKNCCRSETDASALAWGVVYLDAVLVAQATGFLTAGAAWVFHLLHLYRPPC